MNKYFCLFILLFFVSFASCNNNATSLSSVNSKGDSSILIDHPDWIKQGNIYEVNLRQYTSEGTFKAFETHLDRLKNMGVQTLWFMPITPISKTDRKGTLGSYYAVANYKAVNPEYGNLQDWKNLVKSAHDKGFKVLTDWVANHTGADHPWLKNHPDFYEKDSTGKPLSAFDWTDTRSLDFNNREMRDSMISSMEYWLTETGIDGYRCDVAGEVPDDFWQECIGRLKKIKNVLMLAEGDKGSLHKAGFDITYAWDMFQITKKIAKGEMPATAIDSVRLQNDKDFSADAMRLYFTSNHDENSWNEADYGTMPGESHAPFAVLTHTMVRSIPLIYSGQEEPILRKVEFFEKDPMIFGKFARAKFYHTLLDLRKNNAALSADASFKKLIVGDEKALYAFVREKAGKKILVIVNLSAKPQKVNVAKAGFSSNEPYNVFMGANETLENELWMMEPWGYAIYSY